MNGVKFRKRPERGAYDVLVDGELVGVVGRWERHYNLRRLYVTRGWRAATLHGEKLYAPDGVTASTRAVAADELVRASRPDEAHTPPGSDPNYDDGGWRDV